VNDSGKEVYRFTKDDLDVITIALTAEKASLKRYLELKERCTNTRLREVIGE
jgi:rubrerythrin